MHILVAALNWGLGHATRCIPIISHLLEAGHQVSLASDGRSFALWKQRFPTLTMWELPSYDIEYHSENMVWEMGKQLPRILNAINSEKKWLIQQQKSQKWEAIISDNRYGLHLAGIPSVFITHQLSPITPFRAFTTLLHKQLIANFSECWIPDVEEEAKSLSGNLSHGISLPIPIRWLGVLSRFSELVVAENFENEAIPSFLEGEMPEITAILSGPEPQRSILAEAFLEKIQDLEGKYILIEGKPDAHTTIQSENCLILPHLGDKDFQKLVLHSQKILSRSGYSSLMDYACVGVAELLLIPTPGQTEQEFLAKNWEKQSLATCLSQSDFLTNGFPSQSWGKGFANTKKSELKANLNAWLRETYSSKY